MSWMRSQFSKFSENPMRWFFYGFVAVFSLSIRKIIFFTPIGGFFNDYTAIFLYLSDILLIAMLFSWLYPILSNNKYKLSSIFTSSTSLLKNVPPQYKCSTPVKMFHPSQNVPRGTIDGAGVEQLTGQAWNILRGRRGTDLLYLLPLAIVLLSFVSIYWSVDQNIAIFRSIRLLALFLLYLYIIKNVPRGTFIKRLVQIIILTGLIHSIVGIWQFFTQHSVGLHWLGESIISRDMIDVANIYLFGNKLIRAYGLFSHPNILGGFLILSMMLSVFYSKMFHVEHFKVNFWLKVIIITQIVALVLTFSKTALVGMVIALLYVVKNNVPRGTLLRGLVNLFHLPNGQAGVELVRMKRILWICTVFIVLLIFIGNYKQNILQSIDERLWYLNYSIEMIYNNPIMGSGMGQFIPQLHAIYSDAIEYWKYQPVHNVYLLVFNELGVIGLIIFILFLYQLLRSGENVPRGTLFSHITHRSKAKCSTWNNNTCKVFESGKKEEYFVEENMKITLTVFKAVLFGYLFIMLFDHYFWDIWQGQVMFWLLCGIIAGHNRLFKALTE